MHEYHHEFQIRDKRLYCERVPIERIVKQVGTPVYIYSYQTLVDHFDKLTAAFKSIQPLICFAVKANGNLSLMKILVDRGAGLDIVSGGELYKALRVGCPPERIVYASVGKRPEEIREALRVGIFSFNVESFPELEAIQAEAQRSRRVARVAIRINPNVDAHTHKHITTGVKESKFGIELEAAREFILKRWHEFPSVQLLGFHLHIGSQITQAGPFIEAIRRVGALIEDLRAAGMRIDWLNLGGGLGIVYKDEKPQTADEFAKAILPHITKLKVKLILEPGRFIVGNAGILATRVLYLKPAEKKQFAVVDAGMTDLIRPALYEAYHEVVPVSVDGHAKSAEQVYDIVGPICESADVLAKDRRLPPLEQGTLLAIMGAGAYGFVMVSNYNGRPRPPEVIVRGDKMFVVRERETLEDLVSRESIPAGLLK